MSNTAKTRLALAYDKYGKFGAFHWAILETDGLYRMRVDTVLEYVRPEHHCLDLGCGDGAYLSAVAPRCSEVVGVDINKTGTELARQMLGKQGIKNVKVLCRDVKDAATSLPLGAFDIVYSMDVIEHLNDPNTLLDLARQCMKPRGLFILGTPLFWGEKHVSPHHVHEFAFEELLDLVSVHHFSVVKQDRIPNWLNDKTTVRDRFAFLVLAKGK